MKNVMSEIARVARDVFDDFVRGLEPEAHVKLILEAIGPLEKYHHQCHAGSIAVVKAGLADRVARGVYPGIGSQHSWAVIGDPYHPDVIIDPTLWSWLDREPAVEIVTDPDEIERYRPMGLGSIWAAGRPAPPTGPIVALTPSFELSGEARVFLDMLGPLDRDGWWMLAASLPVEDWPAGEIYAAMDDTEELSGLVPIDRLGMLTDRNPGGLYLP